VPVLDRGAFDREVVLLPQGIHLHRVGHARTLAVREDVDGLRVGEGDRGLQAALQQFARDEELARQAGDLPVRALLLGG